MFTKLTLNLRLQKNLEVLFMKDPASDLFLLLQNHIIPLHLDLLANQAKYFTQIIKTDPNRNHKIEIVQEPLDIETVTSVMKLFYGSQLSFSRQQLFKELVQVIQYFKIQILSDQIWEDIEQNFDEYDFFLIMQLANKYKKQSIESMCWNRLKKQKFEQIYYNQFDLLMCDENLFMKIIRRYFIETIHTGQVDSNFIKSLIQEHSYFCKSEISFIDFPNSKIDNNFFDDYENQTFDFIDRKLSKSLDIIRIPLKQKEFLRNRSLSFSPIQERIGQQQDEAFYLNSNQKQDQDLSTEPSPQSFQRFADKDYTFTDYFTNFGSGFQENKENEKINNRIFY